MKGTHKGTKRSGETLDRHSTMKISAETPAFISTAPETSCRRLLLPCQRNKAKMKNTSQRRSTMGYLWRDHASIFTVPQKRPWTPSIQPVSGTSIQERRNPPQRPLTMEVPICGETLLLFLTSLARTPSASFSRTCLRNHFTRKKDNDNQSSFST